MNSLMFSAGTFTIAGSIRFSARTNAPSSRVSSSIVAACVRSVEFMSFQDFRASGLRRLSTVSTIACIHGDKWNVSLLSSHHNFSLTKSGDSAANDKKDMHGQQWQKQQQRLKLKYQDQCNRRWTPRKSRVTKIIMMIKNAFDILFMNIGSNLRMPLLEQFLWIIM